MRFVVAQLRYPPQRFTTPLPILTRLLSKDHSTRQAAIEEIWNYDDHKGKWHPFYDRFFIETFYRYFRLNTFASQRGLTWKAN